MAQGLRSESRTAPAESVSVATPSSQSFTRRLLILAASITALPLQAQQVPRAIYVDPPHDKAHPARMEVLHIPSGGTTINGVAYLASGPGVHPTFVFFHGLPGNEKNLDLAQAVRRAGWNAVTVNYRGSWGSPGQFRFGQTLEDANATLAFLRDSAAALRLGIDTSRLVIAGHSMGGWIVALTAAHDHGLLGGVLISAADMSKFATGPRAELVQHMAGDMEALAGVTPESMANDLLAGAAGWRLMDVVPGLAHLPLLVMSSDDGLAPQTDTLVAAIRAKGNKWVTTVHQPTDHSWSDKRVALESSVLRWLAGLPPRRAAS
ncbi:MAG: hypothetical protein NVS4B3_18850 [Gemmatimonadaceae bacterium]